jgi:glycosyltransferase involved in cell wall biosynthesis
MSNLTHNSLILAWPKQKNKARNPFQFLLYKSIEQSTSAKVEEFSPAKILRLFSADILHIHWPDAFLAAGEGIKFWPRYAVLRFICGLAALTGTKVIWTAHNLQRDGQRNASRLKTYFWPWFLKRIDGIIFMTNASKQNAHQRYTFLKNTPFSVIPHGHYCELISQFVNTHTENDSKSAILFFGSITPYKNAHKLLNAFLDLPPERAQLRIKGKMSLTEPDILLQEKLQSLPPNRIDEVVYEDGFLTDKALVAEIIESDLVVFPYTDVLNSGAAIYALSVGRPVLASDTALFRELQSLVGKDWVYLIEKELNASVLLKAIEKAQVLKQFSSKPDLSKLEWKTIAQQTSEFYQRVLTQDNKQ